MFLLIIFPSSCSSLTIFSQTQTQRIFLQVLIAFDLCLTHMCSNVIEISNRGVRGLALSCSLSPCEDLQQSVSFLKYHRQLSYYIKNKLLYIYISYIFIFIYSKIKSESSQTDNVAQFICVLVFLCFSTDTSKCRFFILLVVK